MFNTCIQKAAEMRSFDLSSNSLSLKCVIKYNIYMIQKCLSRPKQLDTINSLLYLSYSLSFCARATSLCDNNNKTRSL